MTDPEALEAAKKFLSPQEMPSTSDSERKSRSVDPLDAALGLGMGTRKRVGFKGAAELPRDMKPKLIKHHYLKHQERSRM